MPRQTFKTVDVLRLEVEDDPTGLVNLIPNPSGELGGWGWITPTANSSMTRANQALDWLNYLVSPTVYNEFTSESLTVAASEWVAARWDQPAGLYVRARFDFYNAAGSVISSSALSGYITGTGTAASGGSAQSYAAVQAPANTVRARLAFAVYQTNAGAPPVSATGLLMRRVTVAKASTAAALSGLGPLDPVPYLNILSPTSDLKVTRGELDVGLLTATVLDATLDPASADTVRPGRRCRVTALDPASGAWTPIFQGKIVNGKVTYDLARTDAKRARIALTAVDATAAVASVPRREGVATIAELPYVLEGAGVPWNVNGSGAQVPAATVVSANDNASALDQVAITRDSVRGYAWIDRRGVVQVWDAAQISTTVARTLDEDDYSALPVDFDTDRCIDIVRVKYLRPNLATGETVEVPYGPYVDQAAVDEWGEHSAEFTVHGIGEANVPAYGAAVLAANAIPTLRVNAVTLPIATPADVTEALTDLYDLVQITNANAALNQSLRVTGVEHTITPDKWLVDLTFAADGGVAPPTSTPSPGAVAAPDDTDGWQAATMLAPFTGSIRSRIKGGVLYLDGSATRAVGSSTSYTDAATLAQTIPPGTFFGAIIQPPVAGTLIAAQAVVVDSVLRIRMSGPNANTMTVGGAIPL